MTGQRKVLNFHARKLIRELTELRIEAGLLQGDVGQSMRMNTQKVSRIETGQLPTFVELQALLGLYGVVGLDSKPYEETWEQATTKPWWHRLHLRDVGLISDEHEASSIRDVQSVYLPMLLRTEAYTRRLLETALPPLNDEQLTAEAAASARRGQLLGGDDPVYLHALIYQPVLHFGVDGKQLRHLLDRAVQPNVTLQIVTHVNGLRGGLESSFTLVSFPGTDDSDVVHTGHQLGPIRSGEARHVDALSDVFDSLVEQAMSPENSLTYLENLLGQLDGGPDEQ